MTFFFCRSSSKQQNKTLGKKKKISELQDQPSPGLGGEKIKTKNQQEKL
jgi:hypothetical protein